MTGVASDFSVLSLFMQADFFVKLIMLALVFMSFMTWAVWFAKASQFRKLRNAASRFEKSFWQKSDSEQLARSRADHPMARLYQVGLEEFEKSEHGSKVLPIKRADRARQMMGVRMIRELEKVESMLPMLATVGSTAPFIGLLGTVWGIMNSFSGIAASKNTSLAVVAPGIAEALLATAFGLIAAIPAVIAYNRLSSEMGRYAARLEAFAGEYVAILERREAMAKEEKNESVANVGVAPRGME